jgi:hypothetical protein
MIKNKTKSKLCTSGSVLCWELGWITVGSPHWQPQQDPLPTLPAPFLLFSLHRFALDLNLLCRVLKIPHSACV